MNRMTLRNYRAMSLEAKQLKELIEIIEARRKEPKGTKYTGMPTGKGGKNDAMAATLARLETLSNIYKEKEERLLEESVEFEKAIASLLPFDRVIMRNRYTKALSWKAIAKEMDYSVQHLKNRHSEIVKKFD